MLSQTDSAHRWRREHYGAPANRLVMFPFLAQPGQLPTGWSALPISEWGNVIHDILQDINANVVQGICTQPKKLVVASLSNGSLYLNQFLTQSSSSTDPILSNTVEVWDFDSDITKPPVQVDPNGKNLRAYWQNALTTATPPLPTDADFVQLQAGSWTNFPSAPPPQPPGEVPPLPPNASNSNSKPDNDPSLAAQYPAILYHHYIRDTMFLDAAWNLDNPNGRQFP